MLVFVTFIFILYLLHEFSTLCNIMAAPSLVSSNRTTSSAYFISVMVWTNIVLVLLCLSHYFLQEQVKDVRQKWPHLYQKESIVMVPFFTAPLVIEQSRCIRFTIFFSYPSFLITCIIPSLQTGSKGCLKSIKMQYMSLL